MPNLIDKFMMLTLVVADMPKAKEFYAGKLGLTVAADYRQDDAHWYVTLAFPAGGATLTLTTYHGKFRPGRVTLYLETPDIAAADRAFGGRGINDDLFGPGSGVKWFDLEDPDGNQVVLAQASAAKQAFA